LGVDDKGVAFTVSSDPHYEALAQALSSIKLGQKGSFHEVLKPILSNERIFAVNLYEAGLGELVETYFEELNAGPGAVAATLKKYTA
jgi:fructuronate reductase